MSKNNCWVNLTFWPSGSILKMTAFRVLKTFFSLQFMTKIRIQLICYYIEIQRGSQFTMNPVSQLPFRTIWKIFSSFCILIKSMCWARVPAPPPPPGGEYSMQRESSEFKKGLTILIQIKQHDGCRSLPLDSPHPFLPSTLSFSPHSSPSGFKYC